MVTGQPFPAVGDQVLVPWGLEELVGEVLEVYSSGLGDRAVVRLLGTGDPDTTVTVPADSLTPASGRSMGTSPRIDAMAFESEVRSALDSAISAISDVRLSRSDLRHDSGADVIVEAGSRRVAIQIKYVRSSRIPSDTISAVTGYATTRMPTILVSNAELTSEAFYRLEHVNRRKILVWYVRWAGISDYEALYNAICEAVAM
jgi:hypothetical protein